ncbi:MAG: hypothetical protein HXY20_07615 [Acidobacteria bacterium]|nr:hypothetical protein [Acidobacteriota bacterium]
MDKIVSARLDPAAVDEMNRAARLLGITKKRFLEEAIRLRAQQIASGEASDVWAQTSGAWKRDEPVATTIRRSRRAFNRAFKRHHGG